MRETPTALLATESTPLDDMPTNPVSDGPGRRLHVVRHQRSMSIESIANQLHLAPRFVEAIERDDYDSLPSPVFTAGYIRNYARLLNIDPTPLLENYRKLNPEAPVAVPSAQPARAAVGGGMGRLLVPLVTLMVIGALGWLAFLWWDANGDDFIASFESLTPTGEIAEPAPDAGGEPPAAEVEPVGAFTPPADEPSDPVALPSFVTSVEQPAASEPTPVASAPRPRNFAPAPAFTPPSEATETAAEISEEPAREQTTEAPLAESTVADEPESAAQTSAPAAEPSAPANNEVVLSFNGPCWVNVRDASGEFKIYGEMKAGDRHVLEGTPPWKMTIGNVASTSLTIGGEPFDLGAKSRGNVARFQLSL